MPHLQDSNPPPPQKKALCRNSSFKKQKAMGRKKGVLVAAPLIAIDIGLAL